MRWIYVYLWLVELRKIVYGLSGREINGKIHPKTDRIVYRAKACTARVFRLQTTFHTYIAKYSKINIMPPFPMNGYANEFK